MKRDVYSLAFMPYANIKEKISFGRYYIWPFYKYAEEIITDKEALVQLKKYFSRYLEFKFQKDLNCHTEQPCQIVIISPQSFEIGKDLLSDKQISEVQSIAHIMAFTSIFEIGLSSTTSDPFYVQLQQFVKNEEGLSVWTKAYANYNLFKVLKPLYVESSFLPFWTTPLSIALAQSLDYSNSNEKVRKIMHSLELIYHTVTFGDMISNEHRLLTLVMAFEVLLGIETKFDFVRSIQNYIQDSKPIYTERIIYVKGGKKQLINWTKTSWWVYDLYDLRSEIIHGKIAHWKIKEYGFIWQRITFAGSLFKRIYKILLREIGLLEDDFMSSFIESYDMDENLEEILKDFKEMNPDLYTENK